MKFDVKKNVIESTLGNLQNFIYKKDDTQITSHIYIEAKDGEVILKATDFEVGLEGKIEANVLENGIATANGKKLLNVIKSFKDDDIHFELQGDELIIKQKRSKFNFPTFVPNEVFNFPTIEEKDKINIDPFTFINSIKKISPVIEMNNNKIELNGALMDIQDYGINFVATNTKRLAIVKIDTQGVNNLKMIIPKRAVNEITRLFVDNIEIYHSQSQLIIKNKSYFFFTKLISGNFPDYDKIVPKEYSKKISINRDRIIEELKRLSSLAITLKMCIKPNEILFYTHANESEKGEGQMDINTGIDDFEIGVNSKYLLEFLGQIEGGEFELCLNEANEKFAVKYNNFITINIPVIL